MEIRRNFVESCQTDVVLSIFSKLDNPADLVRAAAVSRSWRHFVISNCLAKNLCLRKAPMAANISNIIEQEEGVLVMDDRSVYSLSCNVLKKDHIMYMRLLEALSFSTIAPTSCIECVMGASSADRYPWKSVVNVLVAKVDSPWGPSYWSSKGHTDPTVPESILFKLDGGVCIVTQINIQPIECFFHDENPIYSTNLVRFRMGHPRSRRDLRVDVESLPLLQLDDDNYVWEYTSPEYLMSEGSYMQSVELTEPVLCIGGYLLIELRDRSQEQDGLYYFCISHVEILGHSLKPAFDIEMGKSPRSISLKYSPEYVADVLRQIAGPDQDKSDENEEYEQHISEPETESDDRREYFSDDEFGNPPQSEPLWARQIQQLGVGL